MVSPFSFGHVVEGPDFTNRKEEVSLIKNTLRSGNHVILISPRRYGKSSLVKQVSTQIGRQKETKVISFDMTSFRSENEFLEAFASQIIKENSSKALWKSVGKLLKHITPTFSIGTGDLAELATVSFNWTEPKKTINEILELPQLMAAKTSNHQMILIDEFQNIRRFEDPEGLQYQMRAKWQHHKNVSYCLYGSKRHMMEEIFTNESAPFYNFGQVVRLHKISENDWLPFIIDKFKKSSKPISENLAKSIVSVMKHHSEYVQFLSHQIWISCPGGSVKPVHVVMGLRKLLEATSIHFIDLFDRLNNTQVKVLKAILDGESRLTSQDTLRKYRLGTSANAVKSINALIKEDFIEKRDNQYILVNPAFELWFRAKILNEEVLENFRNSLK